MEKAIIHRANSRGFTDHDWLLSYHTFSFANYYNPERTHFGALRVLNDDIVKGGQGFPMHPHKNMEIVSIPLSGALEHEDSTGKTSIIREHDVQIMSAGYGIKHSEYNHNKDKEVNFLQIWVYPKINNIEPGYEQKTFKPEDRKNKIQTIVSPLKDEIPNINQDAWFSMVDLDKNKEIIYKINRKENGIYAFVIKGNATIEDQPLNERDGLGLWKRSEISIIADTNIEILLIEVPMDI